VVRSWREQDALSRAYPMTQPLEVDISRVDGADILDVRGELDVASALGLAGPLTEIATDGDTHVVLDLTELSFMDSTGMSVLLNARRRLTRQGRHLLVVCPAGPVMRLFELTSLVDTLRVHPSKDAALASLDSDAG
jgi:anti-sigma B factor antagonist